MITIVILQIIMLASGTQVLARHVTSDLVVKC